MKIPKLTSVAIVIVALSLNTPFGMLAYAADRDRPEHHHGHINKASIANNTASNKTTSGFVDTTQNGQGVYTQTKTGSANDMTVTRDTTFADGKTVVSTDVITKNANGTNYDITTYFNDKTSVNDYTLSASGAITGTLIQSNGQVDQETGTKEKTSYGYDTTLTYTNAQDQTKTVNDETLKSSDAVANVVTGTNFNGKAIDNASLQTTNTAPNVNTVDTTVDGQGTYSINKVNNTINTSRSFGDGAGLVSSNTITQNPNGTTTYDRLNSSTSSTGVQSSSIVGETYSSNGSGGENIAGTFTQSNGHYGLLTGTDSQTNYGFINNTTSTDQNGLTKSNQTETLTVGDAILNVNTGTTFAGTANDSNALITGQASDFVSLNHPESN